MNSSSVAESGTALRGADTSVAAILERAAQLCEEQARAFLSPDYATDQPLSSFAERFACGECAKAIRAEILLAR
jgi:hypothetical protein